MLGVQYISLTFDLYFSYHLSTDIVLAGNSTNTAPQAEGSALAVPCRQH